MDRQTGFPLLHGSPIRRHRRLRNVHFTVAQQIVRTLAGRQDIVRGLDALLRKESACDGRNQRPIERRVARDPDAEYIIWHYDPPWSSWSVYSASWARISFVAALERIE